MSDVSVDIVNACRSYTEKSRSGRGLHIILKGSLPFKGKNNRQGVEIYKTGRYFIMTGKKMLFSEIIENQNAIDYVVDKYFKDSEKESEIQSTNKIYRPVYPKPINQKISLRPVYPPIKQGCRNISLTSLAGQFHTLGYDRNSILTEISLVNKIACDVPLPEYELVNIVNSVTRYKR